MKKNIITIILIACFTLTSLIHSFASTTVRKEGESSFSPSRIITNKPLDPLKQSGFIESMTIDGKIPKAILVSSEPDLYGYEKNGKQEIVVAYKHKYFGFYDDFPKDGFIVKKDLDVHNTYSQGGGYFESASFTQIFFDTELNNYNPSSIVEFELFGYDVSKNKYIKPHLEQTGYTHYHVTLFQNGSFDYLLSAEPFSNLVIIDDTQKFISEDGENFYLAELQGIPQMDSEPLELIPKLVNLAVVFLVSCLILYWVLKISLRLLREFLPI